MIMLYKTLKKLKERKLSEESNYMNYKKSEYKKVNEEKHKNKKFNVRKNQRQ